MAPAPHDIFICFSSRDAATALDVVGRLEATGLRCWISTRDVPPGANYQEAIVHALEAARALVFLFSEASAQSGEIRKELSLAGAGDIPVFPLRLSPIIPTGALRYELTTRQWIDFFPDAGAALARLAETIRAGLANPPEPLAAPPATPPVAPLTKPKAVLLNAAEIEAARALLARHIGPIARVVVTKAAQEADDIPALRERLASHVPQPTRAVFLDALRAALPRA